jgi:regulator of protease activity HflC (stomatin/prohibitin superfamily)
MAAAYAIIIVLVLALLFLFASVKVAREYERGVVFRLGRLIGIKGPGLFILIPFIDKAVKVDLRTITLNVPPQEVITKDNVTVKVNAVAYFRVVDAAKAIVQVENYLVATSQIAQTTLRSVLGQVDLDSLLAERDQINDRLQSIIDEQTHPWGVKVSVVEVKDVEIPSQMQRAMARQAESERERRAKIIAAEGEYQASERLRQAADRLESPTALQLRLFQTMGEIAVNQNSTIILPVPIDLLRPYLDSSRDGYGASAQKSEEERRREEREAQRRYQETIGEASREVPGQMPDGEANL